VGFWLLGEWRRARLGTILSFLERNGFECAYWVGNQCGCFVVFGSCGRIIEAF